jgi:hypothetical protein
MTRLTGKNEYLSDNDAFYLSFIEEIAGDCYDKAKLSTASARGCTGSKGGAFN